MLDPAAEHAHKRNNVLQTVILLAGIGSLLALSAGLLFGWYGIYAAAAAVLFLLLCSVRVPPGMMMRMYKARPAEKVGGKQLVQITRELAKRAELAHVPAVYIIPSMTLNAFAAGCKSNAAIGVTEGMLRKLSMRELAGVLAHEISHIKHNDLLVMSFADLMSRLTQILSYAAVVLAAMNVTALIMNGEAAYGWVGIIILYLAPGITNLMQLGLSRVREYDADLSGARLTGDPQGLAQALSKVERYTGRFWEDLMMPVPGRRVPQPSLLRSHPATEDRISRLQQLKQTDQTRPVIVVIDEPMISMVGLGPISMRPRYRFPGIWY